VPASPSRRLLYAHNGPTRLAYTLRGQAGPPVVFVNGYMARRQVWALQVASFSRTHRLLLYDRRGGGDSDRTEDGYDLDAQVDDLDAVVRHAGWDRFDLVGHSMGGFIAMAYAIRHPARVRRLGLLATAPYRTTDSGFGVGVFITRDGAPPEWSPEGIRHAVDLLIPEPEAVWLRMEMARTIPEYAEPGQARQTFEAFDNVDLRADLHRITAPTLILHGSRDNVVPMAVGQSLASHIPAADFQTLPGLGHMLMITGAKEVNTRLAAFLGERP
jgi:pimeloyl-ACP methyl ester carboxylesterase